MELTDEQKCVFKDPYFWALAGLPDPDGWLVEDDDDWVDEDDDPPAQILNNTSEVDETNDLEEDESPDQVVKAAALIPAPQVHRLSAQDEARLRPVFEDLVDRKRIELNYGKPAQSGSVSNIVTKGQAAFKQAHANVSCFAS